MSAKYNPICEICAARPKMDRCDCCEECWYSGRYSETVAEMKREWAGLRSRTIEERRRREEWAAMSFRHRHGGIR